MADDITQIKNPSLLAEDLAIKLSGDAITAISGHPLIGTGGGTQSDWIYVPSFDTETGNVLFELGTTADNPQPEGGWYISGAQGPQGETGPQGIQGIQGEKGEKGETGPQGIQGETGPQGASGYTPLMRINSTTNYWEVSYDEGATYTSLDVSATGPKGEIGPQGEQGIQGETGPSGANGSDGTNGITPELRINTDTNYWEVSYDEGSSWDSLDVSATGPQGQSGASGASGFSPTMSTKSISNGTKTGTEITFTTINGETSYSAWNGTDGTGTTYSIQGNNGISAELDESTSTYNIGISAHYISAVNTDNDTISGDGVTNPLGVNNTYVTEWNEVTAKQNKTDMSAYPTFVGMTADENYYCWSGTSGAGGQWMPISDKFYSKTEADGRYQKQSAMSAYLDKTEASELYLPLSGGTVSGSTYFSAASGSNIVAVASAANALGVSRQTSDNFGNNTNAIGTTWIGVAADGSYQGFIKYVDSSTVGQFEGTSIQMNLKPTSTYGEITVNSQNTNSRVINVPSTSYDNMSAFDAASGPNYMLRKTASGFDIGAMVVNVTAVPETPVPNTYYFVYET